MESIAYAGGKAPARPHFVRTPQAEVRIDQAPDGRWMWAVSYYSSAWGFGYAPLPKWGNFAADRAGAIAEGVAELRDRLSASRQLVPAAVLAWLESLQAPTQRVEQLDLFGASA